MTHILHVSIQEPSVIQVIDDDGEVLDTLLIMLDTQNSAQMFGGTCDHKLLGHWDDDPPKPSAGARKKSV